MKTFITFKKSLAMLAIMATLASCTTDDNNLEPTPRKYPEDVVSEIENINDELAETAKPYLDGLKKELLGHPEKANNAAFIAAVYCEIIDRADDLTNEEKMELKTTFATALYSAAYWIEKGE